MKCMFEGGNSATKCAVALNQAGNPCSFCTILAHGGGHAPGSCVDPTEAETKLEQSSLISCTNVDKAGKDKKVESG